MGCGSSKGGCSEHQSLGTQHDQQHDPTQQEQQQHPQADLVLRVLLNTDPRSTDAKRILLPFHTVCREGRAAALRTVLSLRLGWYSRDRHPAFKRPSFHDLLLLIQAADRATDLWMGPDQVPGLLHALQQQQQQTPQGGRMWQRLLAPRQKAGSAFLAPATIPANNNSDGSSSNAAPATQGTTTNTSSSGSSSTTSTHANAFTGSSSTAATAWTSHTTTSSTLVPPGPVLDMIRVVGQPTRALAQQLMVLLDGLPATRRLVLGNLYASRIGFQSPARCFMDHSLGSSKQRSRRPAAGHTWRRSCTYMFVGGFLRPLDLDDMVLLLGSLSRLDALYGFWLDVSTLPRHADLLLGLWELWLEKTHGLEKEGVVEALASCTNLRTLGLHDCALGELPQAFPQLTRMTYLDLSNTDVSLRVVEALCDLSGLEQLHLSRAPRLTSLPSSISRLTGLYSLSLLESKVTRLPDSMTAMSSLRELAWGGRQLQLDVVWHLTGLNTLALSDATAPSLPTGLGQLTGLSALMVEGVALAALPDSLSKLVGLERLTISAGGLTALPAGITALTRLTGLVLNCPLLQPLEPAVQAFVEWHRRTQSSSSR